MAITTQFKLSKQGGLTRRLAFQDRPSWDALSSKIGTLYGIATYNVGVSYIDQDGDEVTFSSEEELQDYYSTLPARDGSITIKLGVQDLSSLRSTYFTPSRPNTTSTPQQSHLRNTFGEAELLPFVFEVDDEWERLPRTGIFGSESPHAFVEVLDSDVSVSKKFDSADEESCAGDTTHSDATFTMHASRTDKGKARDEMRPTVEDEVSSTDSVIGDDVPSKPDVHVYDLSHSDKASIFGGKPRPIVPASGTATPAQAQSTPINSSQALPEVAPIKDSNAAIDDPAVPTVDSSTANDTSTASLTHDVASFLTTVSGIISSHPELSEGIHNIVSNATSGAYWVAHREALSRAAENIQQETGRTVEEIRRVEEEAGVKVADALGSVFRAFGEAVQATRMATATESPQSPVAQDRPRSPESAPELDHPLYPRDSPLFQRYPPQGHFPHPPPHPPQGHFPHPPPPPPPGHFPHHHHHHHPPPPLGHLAHHPLHHWGRRHGWLRPSPPLWGVPPPTDRQEEATAPADRYVDTPRSRMSDIRTTLAEARNRRLGQSNPANVLSDAPVSSPIPSAPDVPSPTVLQGDTTPFEATLPTPEELRADVERAKADYKMRKERYRQAKAIKKMAEQREQRQESSDSSMNVSGQPIAFGMTEPTIGGAETSGSRASHLEPPVPPNSSVPPSPIPAAAPAVSQPVIPTTSQVHIVSNARGPYPQLEMFSVPRRSHTIGHTQRRGHGIHEERESRSMQRIIRKLSEMGFTEGTYPKLNIKVTEQVLANPPATKDAEEDIVTNLIEELIPSNTAPQAGSSRDPIPGAWS